MNMKVVYYFIVYVKLRYVNAKLLPYVKIQYSAASYSGVLIYKIIWKFVLLKIDQGKFCVLRACPLQGPTMSCIYIVPRSLDRRTTSVNQLYSIELPMYSH